MIKITFPLNLRSLSFLLILSAWSSHVDAQELHGTIAVVRYDPTRVIVAADSRHNLGEEVGAIQNDLACKVAALGEHVVFVAAGLVGYDNKGPRDRLRAWRADNEARRVYAELTKKRGEWQDDHLEELAASWGDAVRSHIVDNAHFRPCAVRAFAVDGLLTSALIATGRGNNVHVAVVQVALDADGGVRVIPPRRIRPEECPPCALGKGEIVTEILELRTKRGQIEAERLTREVRGLSEDEREIRRVIRLVDLTISLHPDKDSVGGLVDALELRAGESVHWIQRKPECPK